MGKDAFKFSGEAAANYDHYLGPLLFEPYAIDLISRLETAGVHSVLEIASGTGRVTRHLRNHFGRHVKLTASDFNADMLQVAKNKLAGESIEFRIEDAQSLSFSDQSFDLVVCQFGLMFLQDKKKGLREALRVLKPGGTFIFNTWDKTENVPMLKIIFNDTILPFFKGEDTNRFLVPFSLHDETVLKGWMEEIGFEDVKTSRVVLKSSSLSPKEIVNAFFIKHSLGEAVITKDPAAFDKIAAEMEQKIERQFGKANLDIELAAFMVLGKKR
jgi:ubiquinone/menaquinone biosynthesis C-methylase UbiE